MTSQPLGQLAQAPRRHLQGTLRRTGNNRWYFDMGEWGYPFRAYFFTGSQKESHPFWRLPHFETTHHLVAGRVTAAHEPHELQALEFGASPRLFMALRGRTCVVLRTGVAFEMRI